MPTPLAPKPYIQFPGTAREALTFYHGIFGGDLTLYTNGDMSRPDGDPNAIGHGILDGPITLFGADADPGTPSFSAEGLMFSILGSADAATLTRWFGQLTDGGTIIDDLQERAWGASDGQVRDRFGLVWHIGFEPAE